MYLPPWGWLVPAVPLALLATFIYARLLIPLAVCLPIMVFGYMDLRWHNSSRALNPNAAFKVVSNNIGQDHNKSYMDFADAQNAYIIALQDAYPPKNGPLAKEHFPKHYVKGIDQFVLLSRFPIRAANFLDMPDPGEPRIHLAAWFELDVNGRSLLVFATHMPTPRQEIMDMKSPSAILSVFGKTSGNSGTLHSRNEKFFHHQMEFGRLLVEATRQAKVPFIVCGDFNIHTHGHTYRRYRENWREAFSERGQGVGATFPGDAHFPAWLRLDNIYCSMKGLQPIHAEVEEGRGSQHRCMAATFEFTE